MYLSVIFLLQEFRDDNPKHRSFSWQARRRAADIFGAKTYTGETGLTIPPFSPTLAEERLDHTHAPSGSEEDHHSPDSCLR